METKKRLFVPLEFMCSKCNWIMNNPVKRKCCEKKNYCFGCYKSLKCCDNQDYALLGLLNHQIIKFQMQIDSKVICYVCDLVDEHETKKCPEIRCVNCEEVGHIERICPQKKKKRISPIN